MEYIAGSIAFVVVVTMGFVYLIVKMAMQYEEKKLAAKAGKNDRIEQILAETQAEMARLRGRVQVLERLATDEDRRLANEINQLDADARG